MAIQATLTRRYPTDLRPGTGMAVERVGGAALKVRQEFRSLQRLPSTPSSGIVAVQNPDTGEFSALDFLSLPTAIPPDGTISNMKLAAAPPVTLKGNAASSNAIPQDLTPSQVKTALAYDAPEVKFTQLGTSPLTGTVGGDLRKHAVRPDQFRLGSDSDDSASLLRARDRAFTGKLPVRLMGGSYALSQTVEFNIASATDEATSRYLCYGDGSGLVDIVYSGTAGTPAIRLIGAGGSAALHHHARVGGFSVRAATAYTGLGVEVKKGAFLQLEDIMVSGLDQGFHLEDCLSSVFINLRSFFNGVGLRCETTGVSNTNSINFLGCRFRLNRNLGMYLIGPSAITYTGGSIEGNGIAATTGDRGGVLIFQPGGEGGVAVKFDGTYFEVNQGTADVNLIMGPYPVTLAFDGCTFNRASGTFVVENHIRVNQNSGDAEYRVIVDGSGFRSYNDYTPSSARPYISTQFAAGVGTIDADPSRNIFTSPIEAPVAMSNRPVAVVRFAGATGGVTGANNVASLVRNGVGDYTVNLQRRSSRTNKAVLASANVLIAPPIVFGESATSVRFLTQTLAGAQTDPSLITAMIFDA